MSIPESVWHCPPEGPKCARCDPDAQAELARLMAALERSLEVARADFDQDGPS